MGAEMEMLESRRLLSASSLGFVPNLGGFFSIKKTILGVPGQAIHGRLEIYNTGARLYPSAVKLGVYISPDQSLADATKIVPEDQTIHMGLRSYRSRVVQMHFNLPEVGIPTGLFYVLVNIDDDGSIPEQAGGSTLAGAPLAYPVGQYIGTYTIGSVSDTLGLTVTVSNGKLQTNVTTGGAEFGTLEADNLNSTLTVKNSEVIFSLHSSGNDFADSISHYVLSLSGSYDKTTYEISGNFEISGINGSGPFHDKGKFSVVPVSSS